MLLWTIHAIKRSDVPGYRWFVAGRYDETDPRYQDWDRQGDSFYWTIPSLTNGGGRYVFRLHPDVPVRIPCPVCFWPAGKETRA